jgi:hypothetical protein
MPETDEEIMDHSTDLAVRESGGVFATRDPAEMIRQATEAANQLMAVVSKAGLKMRIGSKDYLKVEAWTTLGVMVGCTARTEWSRPVENGWEAAVEVVNAAGVVIGRAEAECLRSEANWKNRDDYAVRSMAQTRAMGKALRMPLGWIAVLAGFEATPAEEMPAQAATEPTAAAASSAPADVMLTFGKHRGETISQIADTDRGYLEWWTSQPVPGDANLKVQHDAVVAFLAQESLEPVVEDDIPF